MIPSVVVTLAAVVFSGPRLQTPHQPLADARIRGAVIDAAGMPTAAADVELVCADQRRRVQTTAGGGFVIQDVRPTECTLQASKAGLVTPAISVTPVVGSGPPPLVLQLEDGRFTEQVVVTPSRGGSEWVSRVPESVTVTTREMLDRRPFTLLGQALREQPGVMVQQTTAAQVSPVIRGFSGQSNLYLVDGVRLNNASWRSGPSQYFSWIDGDAAESLEVVRGSGALQYGSDGLGGAIQVMPRRPTLRAPGSGLVWGATLDASAATVDVMGSTRMSARLESEAISVSGGIGATRVGDLRAGGGGDSHATVTRFLGIEATPPDGRLRDTGYGMTAGHANVVARVGQTGVLLGTYMTQSQRDVTRYDRTDGGDGLYRSGFTPQRLDLAMLKFEDAPGAFIDRWSATLSLNRQADGRFEQTRPSTRRDEQDSVTTAWGYQAQASRFWAGRHQLMVGGEVYDEGISATRRLIEPSGSTSLARPDIPDGTTYLTTGVFAQQVSELWRNRLWLRGGVRYSRFRFTTTADPVLKVTDDRVLADAFTFQGGAVFALTSYLNATVNVSRGFRAGNAADLGGIGLTGGGGLEISPDRARELGAVIGSNEGATAVSTGQQVGALEPEIADTFEVGVKAHGRRLSGSISVFDVELRDTIQRRTLIVPDPVVGVDIAGFVVVRQDASGRVFVAEDSRPIVTRVNLDRARIRGVDAEATAVLGGAWTTSARVSLANGRVRGGDYLRRMPPPMGGMTVGWFPPARRGWAEAVVSFARPQTRFNAGDLTDARIGARRTAAQIASYFNGTATDLGLVAGGRLLSTGESLAAVQARVLGGQASTQLFTATPGYVTLGVRAGWTVTPSLGVTVIGDNLLDRNYRVHASGVDGPGRGIQVRIRYHLRMREPRR
jgi:hemoglobin/transferrin/lactoferrin receptor protein